jgi:hypothetical protein
MGLQDRDYYWERRDKLEREGLAKTKPVKHKRQTVDLIAKANTPKLWGADWHWSIKLLVWLAILVLLLLAMKLVRFR